MGGDSTSVLPGAKQYAGYAVLRATHGSHECCESVAHNAEL